MKKYLRAKRDMALPQLCWTQTLISDCPHGFKCSAYSCPGADPRTRHASRGQTVWGLAARRQFFGAPRGLPARAGCACVLGFSFLQKDSTKPANMSWIIFGFDWNRPWMIFEFYLKSVTLWVWLSNLSNFCKVNLASDLLVSLNKLISEKVFREDFLWARAYGAPPHIRRK